MIQESQSVLGLIYSSNYPFLPPSLFVLKNCNFIVKVHVASSGIQHGKVLLLITPGPVCASYHPQSYLTGELLRMSIICIKTEAIITRNIFIPKAEIFKERNHKVFGKDHMHPSNSISFSSVSE